MSFLEYLNKKVLKDFGVKDFQLEDKEVEILERHRENYRSFHWIAVFFLVIAAVLLIVSLLQGFEVIPTAYSEILQTAYYFFLVASVTSTLARFRSGRKYKKFINMVKFKGLNGILLKISPYNCINYGKGKFIMLEQSIVNELELGALDLKIPLNNPNKVVAINMTDAGDEDFTCDFVFDISKKDVSIEARVPSEMYQEFHEMCLNGKLREGK